VNISPDQRGHDLASDAVADPGEDSTEPYAPRLAAEALDRILQKTRVPIRANLGKLNSRLSSCFASFIDGSRRHSEPIPAKVVKEFRSVQRAEKKLVLTFDAIRSHLRRIGYTQQRYANRLRTADSRALAETVLRIAFRNPDADFPIFPELQIGA
jgi:hypothetical protein